MQNETIGYRLSPQQARVWALAQRSQTYRSQCAILIQGRVNIGRLKTALAVVAGRNGILRTTFHRAAGLRLPVQVVADRGDVAWSQSDLTGLTSVEANRALESLLREDDLEPFDYAAGPLFRCRLIAISTVKHILIATLPSLCADAATLDTLFREIARCYGSADTQELPAETELEYIQFSEWQLELLEDDASAEGRNYWLNQSSVNPTVDLPFEARPESRKSFRPRSFQFAFDEETRKAITSIAELYDCSASAFLLASFQTLLWRLSGQSEISIKRMIDGRKYEELREVMGLFGKWIPIRCLFRDDMAFSRIVRTIEGATSEAGLWHEYFVPEAAGAVDDDDRSIGFEFEDQSPRVAVDGVAFSIYRQHACFEPFKIKLSCFSNGDSQFAEFHYDSDLFHDDYIEALARYFQNLIKNAAKNPHALVGDIEMLSEGQRREVLKAWNTATRNQHGTACLHELFEQHADKNADLIAVEYEGELLTYAALNARANKLANYLIALGAGAETLVGIYLERGPELLVTILSVLKAGAAYLPIDPSYPADRITFMLGDANVKILITQEALAGNANGAVRRTILVEELQQALAGQSDPNLGAVSDPDNAAYVIYTSGSTGKPKGVVVTHRNVARLFEATRTRFSFDEADVWTLFHSCAFDFSVWEIWGALLHGGRLVVVPYWVSRDPIAFHSLLSRERVTILNQTPSAFRQLIAAAEAAETKERLALRRVIFGGEALDPRSLKPWFDRNGDHEPALVNMYGITETTVHVTHHAVWAKEIENGSTIGRAIDDWQAYLLNSAMRLVPPGVSGEIHVSGSGLARGYLNHPDLTADRFRPDPFNGIAGARIYKSGDLGRYQHDGNIEYLGRIDHQVKIRGFRIELGEIEAVIRLHPAIREAVVIAREDEAGHKRLVAYVVPLDRTALDVDELHSLVGAKLPDYMTPGHFIALDRLPLTTNGKLDRKALPAPGQETTKTDASFVAPRNEIEATLANIWSQVLGVERVGVHDNFFKLGGDSIISIQIIARATQEGIRLTPKQFFDNQTIAELAAVAGTATLINSIQGAVSGSVPLTPIQHWFFEQQLSDGHHFNQSLILDVKERLDIVALKQAIDRLLEHHDALRMRFTQQGDGTWRQENLEAETNDTFAVLDLAEADSAKHRQSIETIAAAAQKSLDLNQGPLMRVLLIDLGDSGSRLVMVIHHLVVDGVSWRILLQDLTRAYEQAINHQPIDLGAKTTSYKEWAEGLVEYAAGDEIKGAKSFWDQKSWNLVEPLPVDFRDGENLVASGRVVSISLNEPDTKELLTSVCEAYRAQVQEILACAIGIGVSKWTGSENVKLIMEGHGREDIVEGLDLTRTVGWFTSVYPLVIDLREGQGWEEKLRSVKEEMRGVPRKGIGYGILRYLAAEQELSEATKRHGDGEIIFNYLGQLDEVLTETRFKNSGELPGPNRSLSGKRKHAIDISASVTEGRMYLHWIYSTNLHRQDTIERVAEDCRQALQELIYHSRSEAAGDFTPSDFPLAQLDQQSLDKALLEIEF